MKPAMNKDEWYQRFIIVESRGAWVSGDGASWLGYDDTETLSWKGREQSVAALALYGQPFGFTREDVELLRGGEFRSPGTVAKLVAALADRIEALLPPEG